ncbi:hypothetical protein [Saccharothrix coeruleofusca]|uniref:Uncharacterized protein n=1 Tax=Saccharothrix coeruleofusca TaxID=33919 RepID=A0A918ATC8_9PSEU|nr:hypothetical protein [Saccharothrix coeruleofusca]GGP68902.1 hypothetical protein GCM10010185_47370 [Saccharothrix coeruleofusca]
MKNAGDRHDKWTGGARRGEDGSARRSFRELRQLFRAGRLSWSDVTAEERAALTGEQRSLLQEMESDVLERPDRDDYGSESVRAFRGGLPESGRRR